MSELVALLPWQTSAWQRLSRQLEGGRLPHALLLTGAAGIGKARFARVLAERLLCLSPGEGLACGECRACLLNRAGHHPDLLTLAPEQEGRAIRIDPVRELVDAMSRTAQQGGARVSIVSPADALNVNAANALLKCLEEPGRDSFFLLLSDRPGAVLPTIRSRCQRVLLPSPSLPEAEQWLSGMLGEQASRVLPLLQQGMQPLRALALETSDGLDVRRAVEKLLQQSEQGGVSPLKMAAELNAFPLADTLYWLATGLAGQVRDAARGQQQDRQRRLLMRHDSVLDALRLVRSGGNPNGQLLLEQLFSRWRSQQRKAKGDGV